MAGKFVVKKAKNDQFMFNLKAANGEIILTSEMYTTKSSMMNGIKSVKANAKAKKNFKTMEGKGGKPYFVLRAGNNQVIGTSEMYSSTSAMENGIESVRSNAPGAPIDDQT